MHVPIPKERTDYVSFLCQLTKFREAREAFSCSCRALNHGRERSPAYKKFLEHFSQWSLLDLSLPELTPQRVLCPDKNIAPTVEKLINLSRRLRDEAAHLVADDKTYLLDPIVQLIVLLNIEDRDFLETFGKAVGKKPKAAPHGSKKNSLVVVTAFMLSQHPKLKRSEIYRHLYGALAPLLDGDEMTDEDSFRRWFKRNEKEIFAQRDYLSSSAAAAKDLLQNRT
jgi:hypothetical protein